MRNRLEHLPIQLASGSAILEGQIGAGGSAEVWAVTRPAELAAEGGTPGRSLDGEASEAERSAGSEQEPTLVLKIGRAETSRFLASEAERLALACSVGLPVPKDVGRLPTTGLPISEWHGAPYLLMTRLPGVPLSQVITDGKCTPELAVAVARGVGRALADLHEAGVAHGDVKPGNILVAGDGTSTSPWSCKLCDLGLATTTDQLMGATPKYLPPEVNNPSLGSSSAQSRDLWALGLTLLEVLQGRSSERELSSSEQRVALALALRPTMPAGLVQIVEGLCSRLPGTRPRARWVAAQAGAKPAYPEHAASLERHYLVAQADFLKEVLDGSDYQITLPGTAGVWLDRASRVLTRIPILNGREAPPKVARLGALAISQPLDAERRRRFLVALCGVAGIDFSPLTSLDDSAFLDRLLLASHKRAPGAFTSDLFLEREPAWLRDEVSLNLATRATESELRDVVSLALELGSERPNPETLDLAEDVALTTQPPLPFVLSLALGFKRRGELGRARAVLLRRTEPLAMVTLAGVLARSGAADEALAMCEPYLDDPDDAASSSAAALHARLLLARGAIKDAEQSLARAVASAAVLEARASVALSHQNSSLARELLTRARSYPSDAEQQARLAALLAHLDHQEGNHEAALRAYTQAVVDAARAGAIVEEATYLVGVGSTAAHLAKVADALAALERAELLFEVIGNPAAQARAALNRASTLAVVGATAEAATSAALAVQLAHKVRDTRCEALGHLVLAAHGSDRHADVSPQEHWQRANTLLSPTSPNDELRLAACALASQPLAEDHADRLDALAVECTDVEIQLEWWTARARTLTKSEVATQRALGERALEALSRLMSHSGPVDIVGQAYAAGAELAAHLGDGDRSLQFIAIARDAHRQIIEGAPAQLKLSARQLPWAAWLARHSSESPLRAEQIGEIERLVRDLAGRSQLRAVLERSLDALIRWTGVERGLLLMSAPEGKLVPRAARNLARQDLSPEHRQLSQTLARRALETGDCVVAMDASGELPSLHHSVHALKLRSVLAVPLIARGDTVGVVYLDDRMRRGAFGSNELAWVRLVGTVAAVAISEARDQARLRRAARRAARAELRLTSHLSAARSELVHAKVALAAHGETGRHGLIGSSPPMLSLYQLIDRVGHSSIPVLLFGESGTGKELVARALHQTSPRRERPFVSENCSAIPAPLLESILFGHKKGAFTGAVQNHAGLFEVANGGTLFLDELGEMSLPMQAKLLRVLETGELRRVGDDRITKVDVRILGASHRNLELMVAQGSFREDLYYRLNVITVRLPPLRERASDIPDLVQHFLKQARQGKPLHITPAALATLQAFAWPGNVRQLENELRRAAVLADDTITPSHLSAALAPTAASATHGSLATASLDLKQQVDALESQLIERALREASGNQSRAAEALGISRFGLQKMVKRLGLVSPK